MKRAIVVALERACDRVDRFPNWTYPLIGRWIGCPHGMAMWSFNLNERWSVGAWRDVSKEMDRRACP